MDKWPAAKIGRYVGGSLLGLLCVWPTLLAAGESLEYSVTYRGVFSLGNDMPIADLSLDTREGAACRTQLSASSEAYATVESLYPLRYRFRTWTDGCRGQTLGFEAFEKTRRLKHRLYLRDDSVSGMRRVDLDTSGHHVAIDRLDTGASSSGLARTLFDRLALLQHLRSLDLRNGAEFDFAVTNGRELMRYRVRVQAAPLLHLDGVSYASWKLRMDAFENGEQGEQVAAHRPAYLWISRDARRIPLRVDVRHAIGLFRVDLVGSASATVARADD